MEVLEPIIKTQSKQERAKVFEELYQQAFPIVARFVRKMGGGLEDAKDIFQDALVIYYEKNSEDNFILNTHADAYILGISKHLWLRKFKNDKGKLFLSEWEESISIPEDYFPDFNSKLLLNFLESAGKKCLDMLSAFYYEKLSMNEIAQLLGYKNERSATVQKYKCLEKVRDTIKEKSIAYEDFTE